MMERRAYAASAIVVDHDGVSPFASSSHSMYTSRFTGVFTVTSTNATTTTCDDTTVLLTHFDVYVAVVVSTIPATAT